MSFTERRATLERHRVHYRAGARVYCGDLIFDAERPILVVSWRTQGIQRVPYVCFALEAARLSPHPKRSGEFFYDGDLLRTGKVASPRPPGASEALPGRLPGQNPQAV